MTEPRYRSRVRIRKLEGSHREAYVAPFEQPLEFGVHSEIAEFYGATTEEELPATLDHVVAAAGG